ncbi:GNAT family N-acetyltransferase [Jiella avicenniae]|uniref:GNAT family N-acetyltransferase n=1 Tax=Jiella avicenniae TaxID=2907202 RepID=A0A9X1P1H1_9HYPH|nr:GNAT family N-acetyltransferase [Jiella avicenniae]MCE7028054.1 GNAT family N-acetyltransferase [Jiella avicenniae]
MRWSAFEELTAVEVHDLLRLRSLVFVVEQACVFAEIDGCDPQAIHLRQFVGEDLAGCLRILRDEDAVRIGRVATAAAYRGRGYGHDMMAEALRYAAECFSGRAIVVSAQAHLEAFYGRHGFVAASAPYDEDGIAHIDMRRAGSPGS